MAQYEYFYKNGNLLRRSDLVRMVVSDVDGTLIYKGSHLNTARFPVMLKKLSERNTRFALATGRHYRELKKLFGDKLSEFDCCCCDGAYCVSNGQVADSLPLPKTCVKAFFEAFASDSKTAVVFHSFDTSFVLGGGYLTYTKENTRLGNVKRVYTLSEVDCDIFFVSLYGAGAASFAPPQGARVSYSAQGICEYVNRNTSKYDAVKKLCEKYSIEEKDIMFFGDGINDAELIEKCGVSYTTYCADKRVFALTENHTRDCIGTVIRLCDENKIGNLT